jgi:hypothetical protein
MPAIDAIRRRADGRGLRPPCPDCLIGCLKCQEVCPANRGLLDGVTAKFASLAITEDVQVVTPGGAGFAVCYDSSLSPLATRRGIAA